MKTPGQEFPQGTVCTLKCNNWKEMAEPAKHGKIYCGRRGWHRLENQKKFEIEMINLCFFCQFLLKKFLENKKKIEKLPLLTMQEDLPTYCPLIFAKNS